MVVRLQHRSGGAWGRLRGCLLAVTALCPRGYCSFESATYAEPAGKVVAEASPDGFYRCLLLATATELPQPATLLDPRMRELSYLGALAIN